MGLADGARSARDFFTTIFFMRMGLGLEVRGIYCDSISIIISYARMSFRTRRGIALLRWQAILAAFVIGELASYARLGEGDECRTSKTVPHNHGFIWSRGNNLVTVWTEGPTQYLFPVFKTAYYRATLNIPKTYHFII